jgi:hypothetical protein
VKEKKKKKRMGHLNSPYCMGMGMGMGMGMEAVIR